jgi:hypothetical protein
MKKKLAVIGIGSAGIQSLCHFLSFTSDEWEITSIHNPNIKILGIGESTNPTFLTALGQGLNFDYTKDLDGLDATVKYGTMFKDWREKDFLNPLITTELPGLGITKQVAIHFNNFKLKEFALPRLHSIWSDKFKELAGNVDDLIDNPDQAIAVVDGKEHVFDYIIDCTGFPKDYTDYYVNNDAPLNHALIHNVKEFETFTYTGHTATPDGWMFEIPLQSRLTYGYLFNDKITDLETAKKNFAKQINVPEEGIVQAEFTFKSFFAKEVLGNRIIKNGNKAIFFEPMSANSIWTYSTINRMFYDFIEGFIDRDTLNDRFVTNSVSIEDIIYYMYHGGTIYDTPFWRNAVDYTQMRVSLSKSFHRTVQTFAKRSAELKDNPAMIYSMQQPVWVFGPYNLAVIDQNFGYYHFAEKDLLKDYLKGD